MIITLGIIITFLIVSNIYTLINIAFLKNDIEDYIIHENLMHDRINKLEEYLGIKRVQKEEKVDKYVKVPKSK